MVDLYAPPDIEPALVACLAVDADVWVSTRFPRDGAEGDRGVIRVSATGGPQPVDRVVVELTALVECWHPNIADAWRVARRAWARLDAGTGETFAGVEFKHVASTGLNNNPDVNRPALHRVQFLTSIHSRTTLLEA